MKTKIVAIAIIAVGTALSLTHYAQSRHVRPQQKSEAAVESRTGDSPSREAAPIPKEVPYSPPAIRNAKLAKIVNRNLPLRERMAGSMPGMLPRLDDPRDIAALISVIGDPLDDETIRNELAATLYHSECPGFSETLIKVLENEPEHPHFRMKVTQYLGWSLIGFVTEKDRHDKIIGKLRQLLDDGDVNVRREALLALVKQRDPKGSEAAVKIITTSLEPQLLLPKNHDVDSKGGLEPLADLRDVAIRCIQDLDLRDQIPTIRQYAHDPTISIRIAAIEALGEWGDQVSRSAFEEAANSKIAAVRIAGKAALDSLEPTLDKVYPVDQWSVETLTRALAHPSWRVRDEAARFLKPYGAKAAPAAPALTEALKNCDTSKALSRIATYIEALRAIGPGAALARPALVEMLSETAPIYKKRDEREVHAFRSFILVTLADIGTPKEALPHVLDYLNNAEPEMQFAYAAAARAAGSLGADAKEGIPLLQRALDPAYNDAAVYFDNFDSVISGSGKQSSARIEAIKALERMGPLAKGSIPLIKKFTGSAGDATNYLPSCKETAAHAIATLER